MSSFNIHISQLNIIIIDINILNYLNNLNEDIIQLLNNKARIIQRFYYNYIKIKNLDDNYYSVYTDEEQYERYDNFDRDYYDSHFNDGNYYDRYDYYNNDYDNGNDNDKLYHFTNDWEKYYDSIYN
jgi:hypothetical protein